MFACRLCAVVVIVALCFCYTWALPRTDPQVESKYLLTDTCSTIIMLAYEEFFAND